MSSLAARRRRHLEDEPGQMCIPGLGENKPRPQSSSSPRSGNSSVRSASPRASEDLFGRRARPRTAHASDSSQMRETLWQPVSPDADSRKEVAEELCVAVDARKSSATPFFDHESGKILIRGGKVVSDDGIETLDVLIDTAEGTIIEVGADLEVPGDCKVIDATDKYVLPGGIDFSTTLHDASADDDDGSLPLADDLAAGSRAALAGGTTMIVDNIVPKKGQSLLEAYTSWKSDVEENSRCDAVAKMGITQWDETTKAEMTQLVKQEGVTHFKVFMAFKDSLMLNTTDLMDLFEHAKSLGVVIHVHAENGDVIAENEKRLLARGVTGPEGHLLARPEELEEEAVKRVCAIARNVNLPIVINAPTSKEATAVIAAEREKGQVVLGAPTAAAMALDGSHYYNTCWDHAAAFVTSPPLRDDPETPNAITEAVADDVYQIVCSDNKTFSTDVKSMAKGDFTAIPNGINGIEDRLSVVWERLVHSEKTDVPRFVAVTSSNAAKALGVYPRKGKIEVGSDADVIVWNANNLRSISRKTHLQAVNFNIFEGLKVHGAPEFVLAGGRVVVYEYEVTPKSSKGRVIATSQHPSNLYDAIQDLDRQAKLAAVSRDIDDATDDGKSSRNDASTPASFGVTTPRSRGIIDEPVMNKRLGIYQRPLSAHGIRNQQDSTFSLAGGYGPEDLQGSPKRTVKVNAPPGGGTSKGAFW